MSKDMKYTEVREIVYQRHKGRCTICGKKLAFDEMCISLIIPKSKGGGKDFANMQAACETCATMKSNMTQEEFIRKIWDVMIRSIVNNFRECLKIGKNKG